jgi:hypothetical protein
MSRRGRQCRVRESRRSLHNRALSRTRAHCGCPRKDRHNRIVGLSECDACRRHSPPRFASNGDVGTPVSKCSLKEDYRIPALAQRTFILVRMSHRQSGQNQWLRCPVGVKGGCGRQADGTAGLPPPPEIPRAFRHLRFVPTTESACLLDHLVGTGEQR